MFLDQALPWSGLLLASNPEFLEHPDTGPNEFILSYPPNPPPFDKAKMVWISSSHVLMLHDTGSNAKGTLSSKMP